MNANRMWAIRLWTYLLLGVALLLNAQSAKPAWGLAAQEGPVRSFGEADQAAVFDAQGQPIYWTLADAPPGTESLGAEWLEIATPRGYRLLAAVFRPATDDPRPVIVLVHGGHGFLQQYLHLARDLANSGFVALAGCWFAGHGSVEMTSPPVQCPAAPPYENPQAGVRELEAMVGVGRSLPGVRADRVGLFGHSRGASAALWYATRVGDVQAAILNSGGYSEGLQIAAQRVSVPLLVFHGTADSPQGGGGPESAIERARALEARLSERGADFAVVYYPGADHSDFWIVPEQRADSYARMIAFYRSRLSDGTEPEAIRSGPE
jgi:dienelactone hydrolase